VKAYVRTSCAFGASEKKGNLLSSQVMEALAKEEVRVTQ
jgi:hypothetical protein